MKGTKIGIICDLHLSGSKNAPQCAFLKSAIEKIKEDAVDIIVCLGDITSHGEIEGYELYEEMLHDYKHYEVMMLSRLVDTFFSRTSWTMLLYAENHSISVA